MNQCFIRTMALGAMGLAAALHADKASALDGCVFFAKADYHIGDKTILQVPEGAAPGSLVASNQAIGDGNTLGNCEGSTTFYGELIAAAGQNGRIPLTIGGIDSGLELVTYVKPLFNQQRYPFPHSYSRNMPMGAAVHTADTYVGYEIFRTSAPLRYGRIDTNFVAQQYVVDSQNKRSQPFRFIFVYDLTLARPTCSISQADLNQTVRLPAYSLANFAHSPDRATPWEAFHLAVEQCPDPSGLMTKFTFGQIADADSDLPNVFSMQAGGPRNVGIELATAAKATIEPGRPFQTPALGAGKQYDFLVRLRETRPDAQPGVIDRPITVTVDYL